MYSYVSFMHHLGLSCAYKKIIVYYTSHIHVTSVDYPHNHNAHFQEENSCVSISAMLLLGNTTPIFLPS